VGVVVQMEVNYIGLEVTVGIHALGVGAVVAQLQTSQGRVCRISEHEDPMQALDMLPIVVVVVDEVSDDHAGAGLQGLLLALDV
jgi:hypothetical protein